MISVFAAASIFKRYFIPLKSPADRDFRCRVHHHGTARPSLRIKIRWRGRQYCSIRTRCTRTATCNSIIVREKYEIAKTKVHYTAKRYIMRSRFFWIYTLVIALYIYTHQGRPEDFMVVGRGGDRVLRAVRNNNNIYEHDE